MRIAVALVLIVLSGCSGGLKKPTAPADLIGRDSMVIVMRELVVLESYVENRYQQVPNFYKLMSNTGKACLKRYHIRPDRFERSYDYYVSHQSQLQSIYSEVLDSLTKEVNKLEASKGLLQDSVRFQPAPDVNNPFPE